MAFPVHILPLLVMWIGSALLAALVLAAGPGRFGNRVLAASIVLESSHLGVIAVLPAFWPSLALSAAPSVAGASFVAAAEMLYLAFLASVPAPLVRRVSGPPMRRALVGAAAVAGILPIVRPGPFAAFGPGWAVIQLTTLVAFAAGLAVALSLWLGSPRGSERRRQGRIYALAFGVKDAGLFPVLVLLFFFGSTSGLVYWTPAISITFYALLAYGMLKQQMPGIDLRIKWSLRRGTVVGAFLAVFLVVAAVAEQWLQRYGILAGGVAVGLLLFAVRPIERAADRLADRAMPRVQDTEEYRTVRRREVYRAAVESALQDGRITEKERDVLATLQEQLGIAPTEALRIEREAAGAGGGA